MNTKALALAAVLAGSASASAQAAVVATQAFVDFGTPTANGGNINTATMFSIGDLVSNNNNSGALAGFPNTIFGKVSFTTTDGTSLSFGNAGFGMFDSTSIMETSNVRGSVSFYVLGDWTPGTYGGAGSGPYPASFTLGFSQSGNTISDSGTFSAPPAAGVPEAPTWAMLGLGFAGLGFAGFSSSRKSVSIVS